MGAAVFLVVIVVVAGYLLPSIIALMRGHKDAPAIILINLFFGWTFIGWFFPLVWSLADPRGRAASQTVVINTTQHNAPISPPVAPPAPRPPPPAAQPVIAAMSPPQLPPPAAAAARAADEDTAFWDGMADKNDTDLLEEYLFRFPDGRFSQLARKRLERQGVDAPPQALPAPRAQLHACAKCGAAFETGARFCTECGAEGAAIWS